MPDARSLSVPALVVVTLVSAGCLPRVVGGCHTNMWLCSKPFLDWSTTDRPAASSAYARHLRHWEDRCDVLDADDLGEEYPAQNVCFALAMLRIGSSAPDRLSDTSTLVTWEAQAAYDAVKTLDDAGLVRRALDDEPGGRELLDKLCMTRDRETSRPAAPAACGVRDWLREPVAPPPGWATPVVRVRVLRRLQASGPLTEKQVELVVALADWRPRGEEPEAERELGELVRGPLGNALSVRLDGRLAELAAAVEKEAELDVAAFESRVLRIERELAAVPELRAQVRPRSSALADRVFAAAVAPLGTLAPERRSVAILGIESALAPWPAALAARVRAGMHRVLERRLDEEVARVAAAFEPRAFEPFAAEIARLEREFAAAPAVQALVRRKLEPLALRAFEILASDVRASRSPGRVLEAATRLAGALEGWEVRASVLAQVTPAAAAAFDAELDRLVSTRRFAGGPQLAASGTVVGLGERVTAGTARVTEAGRRFHEGEARRHLAAGRRSAAYLHTRLASLYGGSGPDVPKPVDPFPPLAIVGGGGCFAALEGSPPGAAGARVDIRWTTPCVSNERTWSGNETYTWTAIEKVATGRFREEQYVAREIQGEACSYESARAYDSGGNVVARSGKTTCVPNEVSVNRTRMVPVYADAPVERTGTRLAVRTELTTSGEATISVTHEDVAVTLPFSAQRTRTKAAFYTGKGHEEQGTMTKYELEQSVAADLRSLFVRGGTAHRALMAEKGRRYLAEAHAKEARDPDGAEDAFARAFLLDANAKEAAGAIAGRYELTEAALAKLR